MRYSIDTAVLEIERRATVRRKQQMVRRLTVGCVALSAALAMTFYSIVRPGEWCSVKTSYGAYLLPVEAGGYVLVGVICFVAAVVVTLLCVHWRDRH